MIQRSSYSKLLEDVRGVLLEGRARAKSALEFEEVRTWWEAARIINEDLRVHAGRAAYGKRIVTQLAVDLGISKDYLYDLLRFQRAFPIVDSSQQLTLSHYRLLARVENSKERRLLYRKAVQGKFSVSELVDEVRTRRLLDSSGLKLDESSVRAPLGVALETTKRTGARTVSPKELKPRRGKFFTYRIVKPRDLHEHPDFYSIDLGFQNRHDLKLTGIKNPKEGEVIEAVRTEENLRGDRYRFKRVQGEARLPGEVLYTYKATVKKVIDDDTLWADIDLGFRFWVEKKLRLRGVDAAEIGKGKEASDFVQRTLARVPFVVIHVSGRDKFDRPLVDLFYLEGTEDREKVLTKGTFLNQELLTLGLAQRV